MRPASNVDEVTYGDAILYTRYSYRDGPWSAWTEAGHLGGPSYWNRAVYPVSINNPVRPDGSRARSAWFHRFSTTAVPFVNVLTENNRTNGDNYQQKILAPILPDNSIRNAVSLASPSSMGDFPYELEARARTNFLKKLGDSTAELGVALAEARQVVGLTRSLSQDIVKGIDKAIKAGRGLPRRVVREIVNFGKLPRKFPREKAAAYNRRISRERAVLNKWLEYQFGLVPLVNDIDEIGRGLSDMLFEQKLPMRMTIVSGSKMELEGGFSGHTSPVFAGCVVSGRSLTELRCHISADYDIPLSQSRTWTQWGMTNPAVVAWEVTQFSWLVDYVFQVGDWLESLTAANGTVPLGGSISKTSKLISLSTKLEGRGTTTVLQPKGWVAIPISNLGWFSRTLVSEVYPSLRPTIRNKLNLTRLANILSVLALRKSFH